VIPARKRVLESSVLNGVNHVQGSQSYIGAVGTLLLQELTRTPHTLGRDVVYQQRVFVEVPVL
jgi:hypothetical protein